MDVMSGGMYYWDLQDKYRQSEVANQAQSINWLIHGEYTQANALFSSERRPIEELRRFIYPYYFPSERVFILNHANDNAE